MKISRLQLPTIVVTLLLSIMFALQATTAWQESQTVDEAVHLSAGFSYLKTGDFRLNPEHPPLIKELAAIPLLFTKTTFPIHDVTWSRWAQYPLGSVFLYENTLSAQTILFLGRLPNMVLTMLLGWLIYRTSRKLFGPWAGVFSIALFAFDPNITAHGSLVTTDLGFTLFSFWTVLRFKALLDHPTQKNALLFAVMLWIAAMSKFSVIAFSAVLLVAALLLKFREHHHPALHIRRWLKYGLIALPIVLLLTWSFYGFDIRRRADDPHVAELYRDRITYLQEQDLSKSSPLVRFVMNVVGNDNTAIGAWVYRTGTIRVPGYAFFRGAIAVIGHSIGGQKSFLHGEFRDTGWWWYFPAAIAVKTPVPTLLAFFSVILIAVVWCVRAHRSGKTFRQIYTESDRTWFLFLSVPILFLLMSMGTHLNLGWRHIMPIYPYFFVLSGACIPLMKKYRWALLLPIIGVISLMIGQVQTYPNALGYFNALIGGSANGKTWLLDSNLDWGQDLPKLAKYMRTNNITSMPFAYYGWAKVSAFVNTTSLPKQNEVKAGAQVHGLIAISIGQLIAPDHRYDWLQQYTPITTVGSSILIYRLP